MGADPVSVGLSAFAQGFGSNIGGRPTTSDGRFSSPFDASGWNINFGSGKIDSNREQSGELGSYLPYVMVAAGLLIAWRLTRRAK